jgi:hypothetical protein
MMMMTPSSAVSFGLALLGYVLDRPRNSGYNTVRMAGPSSIHVDVRTSATLALEDYRSRLIRVFDMLDDAASGKYELPLEKGGFDGVIEECVGYLLEGEAHVNASRERIAEHIAKTEKLAELDRQVEAASRELYERCHARSLRSAALDDAVRNARIALARLERASRSPVSIDMIVRASERFAYTRQPPPGWSASGGNAPLAPVLPGMPGDTEMRASLLYRLQVCDSSAPMVLHHHPLPLPFATFHLPSVLFFTVHSSGLGVRSSFRSGCCER